MVFPCNEDFVLFYFSMKGGSKYGNSIKLERTKLIATRYLHNSSMLITANDTIVLFINQLALDHREFENKTVVHLPKTSRKL
jgi:hypothetical protein